MMDILFKIGVAWFCVTYLSVYAQTSSYPHLITSLGAALNLVAYLFLDNAQLATILAVSGRTIFTVGLVITITFAGSLERERLKTSSWKEILLGKVPKGLQTNSLSEKAQMSAAFFLAILFAAIFYFSGDQYTSVSLLFIAVVLAIYLVRTWTGPQKEGG